MVCQGSAPRVYQGFTYNLKLTITIDKTEESIIIFQSESGGRSWYTIRSLSWRILIAGLFSVTLIVTTAPRQKTWLILPFLCRSLHLPHRKRYYEHNEWVTKALFLELMSFFRWSMAWEFFRLTNFTITCFVVLVEFLPRGSLWQPPISIGDILISKSLQMFTTFSSRSWSGI